MPRQRIIVPRGGAALKKHRAGAVARYRAAQAAGKPIVAARAQKQARAAFQAQVGAGGNPRTPAPAAPPKPPVVKTGPNIVKMPKAMVTIPSTTISPASNAGIVMLLAALLFVLSQRSGLTPLFKIWAGKHEGQVGVTATNPLEIVGAIVFIVILGILAGSSSDMTAVLLVMIFAMWLLWLILGGGGAELGGILKSISPTPAASTASSTTAQGGKA